MNSRAASNAADCGLPIPRYPTKEEPMKAQDAKKAEKKKPAKTVKEKKEAKKVKKAEKGRQ